MGIAAFFGVVMNVNYLLAGTVGSNPILAIRGLFLVLAWRIAGWWGLDRWLLSLLGTPWTGPRLARRPGDVRRDAEPLAEPTDRREMRGHGDGRQDMLSSIASGGDAASRR